MFKKLSILLLVLVFIAAFAVTAMATPPVDPPSSLDGVYKFKTQMNCKKLSDGKKFKIKKASRKRYVSLRFVDNPGTDIANVGDYRGNVYATYDKKTNTLSDPLKDDNDNYLGFYIEFVGNRTWDTTTSALTAEDPTRIMNGYFYSNPSENNKIPNLFCNMWFDGKFKGKKPLGFNRYRMNGWNLDWCYTPFTITPPPPATPYNNANLAAKCKSNWKMRRLNDLPETESVTQKLEVDNTTAAPPAPDNSVTSDSVINCPSASAPTVTGCSADIARHSTVILTSTTAGTWTGPCVDGVVNPKDSCTVVLSNDVAVTFAP